MSATLKLYNTATKSKEPFQPIQEDKVGLYACGPTVYWYQHIGNLRTYISEDVLHRVLERNGYKVNHIINVTDVGHLTSDADVGEDKLVKALERENLPLTEESMHILANKYLDDFIGDFHRLNIIEPNTWCKATDHIEDMVNLIGRIENNGYAYPTDVGLIFDTQEFPRYADFAHLKTDDQEQGARTKIDDQRKHKSDFALWLTNQPNHVMQWDSPWGRGFPGWHIECSAMSMKYLGEQFDIHCGGKEHINVHHTNEIAQSEAATGKSPWVKYWVHTEWLVIPSGKMSKSKGSFTRIQDIEEEGIPALAYRYFCYSAHYRSPLTFSWEALKGAAKAYKNLKQRISDLLSETPDWEPLENDSVLKYQEEFNERINDDLNMPRAIALLNDMVKDVSLSPAGKLTLIASFDEVLALNLLTVDTVVIPDEVKELARQRSLARTAKQWEKADELRDLLAEKGFVVKDSKDGYTIVPLE